MHGVEAEAEAGFEEAADFVEVEEGLHELGVVFDRVDEMHIAVADLSYAGLAETDVGDVGDLVAGDALGALKDF